MAIITAPARMVFYKVYLRNLKAGKIGCYFKDNTKVEYLENYVNLKNNVYRIYYMQTETR